MRITIPDDFPDGPAYVGLTNTTYIALVDLWIYVSRHHIEAMPVPVWERTFAPDDRALLIEKHLVTVDDFGARPPVRRQTRARVATSAEDPRFSTWWAMWPRKQSRLAAERAFGKALRVIEFDALMDATRRYVDDPNREDRYTPHGASWLNGQRWTDAPLPAAAPRRLTGDERFAAALNIGRQIGSPNAQRTPAELERYL
ncbi:hypothetical protein ACIGO9_28470 [Nocardia asteroides]|uniref:hypothetical protein n=1 Tax=Nocardia asteroides TaxID=1824 RepID=UPI0037C7B905